MNVQVVAAGHDHGIVSLILSYWWLIFFAGGAVDWVLERFGIGILAIAAVFQTRHERRLERLSLQLEIEQRRHPAAHGDRSIAVGGDVSGIVSTGNGQPVPGRCVHRRVKRVRDAEDVLVAWLCTGCDTQLPADWAVRAEDL